MLNVLIMEFEWSFFKLLFTSDLKSSFTGYVAYKKVAIKQKGPENHPIYVFSVMMNFH